MGFESQIHRIWFAGEGESESLGKRVCAGMRLIECSSLVAQRNKGNLLRSARIAILINLGRYEDVCCDESHTNLLR